jgi:hypothetical protein
MKKFIVFSMLVLWQLSIDLSLASSQVPPTGFEAIFNGKNLAGWYAIETYNPRDLASLSPDERESRIQTARATTSKFWRVEDGEIVNDGQGPFLTTESEYRDFELLIDYKTVAKADRGIYLKATPQVQIWDSTEVEKHKLGADKGSGGLWNNSQGAPGKDPLELADNPFGEWNRFRIRQIGSRTDVWLNDKHIVKHAIMENYWDPKRKVPLIASGPIQLQTHGGEIRWRNIFIREIPVEEANRLLASEDQSEFKLIFNGSDFTGWQGPVENYEIENGVIRCKPDKGGTIFTTDQYDDFVTELEFRLPAGGNNGLAIRYPGSGDAAYQGMCELQVLDNEHEKFANLDPQQYHGSAYGMVAAHRGYLRPTGEWNFQRVTVKGSTLLVELNGTIILDCDLADVNEFLDDKSHPGRDRKSGYFGLAGHHDPVEFRNLKIKRLATRD